MRNRMKRKKNETDTIVGGSFPIASMGRLRQTHTQESPVTITINFIFQKPDGACYSMNCMIATQLHNCAK